MLNKITGTFVYATPNQPTPCYNKEKGSEWKISVVVDEDTADTFNELYPKQSAKVVKTSEFEDIYKCSAPYPDEKKQYIITLRKNTLLANGKPVPEIYQPKVFIVQGDERVELEEGTLVGNGTKGSVSIDHYSGKMGDVARLKNVLITDLVAYVKTEGAKAGSGDEFDDEQPAEKAKPAAKTPAKKSKEASEESPF